MKKILLAYSGGLDTTFCAVYLSKVLQYEVHLLTVNTGAFTSEEISQMKKRSEEMGVHSFKCIDVVERFYSDCIKYLIYGNVLKNGTYPLSVSAERIIQAITIAKYAKTNNISHIAHGSTGAGNDQVRFDMIFNQIMPNAVIITPIRDLKLSRDEEIAFLKEHNISYNFEKAAYSINKGIWGTSIGGKETLTSEKNIPDEAWPTPVTSVEPRNITLTFTSGELTDIDNIQINDSVKSIQYLQEIAQPYGIGRDIHVGDTIIGIKGRVGFEAAAPVITIKAHHLLEKHVLTKWQLYWKEQLALWYGNWLHEGQMLDPVMRNLEAFLTDTQKNVSGKVFVTLHPYRFVLNGIQSEHDLMSSKFGTYGEMNNTWNGEDVKGFTKIFGQQTSIYNRINNISING